MDHRHKGTIIRAMYDAVQAHPTDNTMDAWLYTIVLRTKDIPGNKYVDWKAEDAAIKAFEY